MLVGGFTDWTVLYTREHSSMFYIEKCSRYFCLISCVHAAATTACDKTWHIWSWNISSAFLWHYLLFICLKNGHFMFNRDNNAVSRYKVVVCSSFSFNTLLLHRSRMFSWRNAVALWLSGCLWRDVRCRTDDQIATGKNGPQINFNNSEFSV